MPQSFCLGLLKFRSSLNHKLRRFADLVEDCVRLVRRVAGVSAGAFSDIVASSNVSRECSWADRIDLERQVIELNVKAAGLSRCQFRLFAFQEGANLRSGDNTTIIETALSYFQDSSL
jgi:hypothetical protein